MVDEPLNFDLTPEQPESGQPPVNPEVVVEQAVPGTAVTPTILGTLGNPGNPGNPGAPGTPGVPPPIATRAAPAAAAGNQTQSLPPIPDFRTSAYPFAMQSRFQFEAPRTKASPRQRLLYGILAAIMSVIVVIGIVFALQAFDRAQRG